MPDFQNHIIVPGMLKLSHVGPYNRSYENLFTQINKLNRTDIFICAKGVINITEDKKNN